MQTILPEIPRDIDYQAERRRMFDDVKTAMRFRGVECTPIPSLLSFHVPGCINPDTGSDIFSMKHARDLMEEKRGRTVIESPIVESDV